MQRRFLYVPLLSSVFKTTSPLSYFTCSHFRYMMAVAIICHTEAPHLFTQHPSAVIHHVSSRSCDCNFDQVRTVNSLFLTDVLLQMPLLSSPLHESTTADGHSKFTSVLSHMSLSTAHFWPATIVIFAHAIFSSSERRDHRRHMNVLQSIRTSFLPLGMVTFFSNDH